MIRFPARDGRMLGGELYAPDEPRGCVLIGAAMAVSCRFYGRYAAHLRSTGLATLTFDYRGIGLSRDRPLRQDPANFHEWGEQDLGGAIDFLHGRYPELPLHFVGHSAGGQLFGLVAGERIASALFVSSGSAAISAYRGKGRAVMFALFHALVPAAAIVRGYLPMSAIGQGEDVPRGVALEWARWGRQPRYVRSYADLRGGLGFERYEGALRAVAFKDDAYAPPSAVESLLSLYPRARKELILHDGPAGHFGFFKQPALFADPLFSVFRATEAA